MTTAEAIERIEYSLSKGPTSGDWLCFYKHKYNEWHVALPIAGSTMRQALFDDGIETANPEADARFIAACNPEAIALVLRSHAELLEALKNVVSAWGSGFEPGESASMDKARAAIQSATQSTKESTK